MGRNDQQGQTLTDAQAARGNGKSEVDIYAERATAVAKDAGYGASLGVREDQQFWTKNQLAVLQTLGVAGAGVGELSMFLHQAARTQLDPFSGQIHMIQRTKWDNQEKRYVPVWTIQTGISGYQVIRDRAARRDGVTVGYDDTIWYDADGNGYTLWVRPETPHACRVVVRKDGLPFPGVVYWSEVAGLKDGKPMAEWKHQPLHMLEKCAEAFALRRAFPRDLSGIYTDEEMSKFDTDVPAGRQRRQAGPPPAADPAGWPPPGDGLSGTVVDPPGEPARAERPIAGRQANMAHLHAVCNDLGLGGTARRGARLGVLSMLGRPGNDGDPLTLTSSNDLTDVQLAMAVTRLEAIKDRAAKAGETAADLAPTLDKLAAAGGWVANTADAGTEGEK